MPSKTTTSREGQYLRLGVNVDHVATVRNARGGAHPDPVRAAHLAKAAGADCVATSCPLCQVNLDLRQQDIEKTLHKSGNSNISNFIV